MDKKFISIIIVSKNSGSNLKRTFRSIMCQTYTNIEVIIQDGNSSDGSTDFLHNVGTVKFHYSLSRHDFGNVYDARNLAVVKSSGKYIMFMNCGDTFNSVSSLETVVSSLLYSSMYKQIAYGGVFLEPKACYFDRPIRETTYGYYRTVPRCHLFVYSRDLLVKHPFDVSIGEVACDYEHFLWCVLKEGITLKRISKPVLSYSFNSPYEQHEGDDEFIEIELQRIWKRYFSKLRLLLYSSRDFAYVLRRMLLHGK